jgi:phenylacetate-CoA ligase
VTTLTKQALPMIRYRTRDITRLATARCGCGRSHLRLQRVTGRSDDMLIVRGVNLYPSQVEAALVGQPGLAPHYRLLIERDRALDRLTVEVELADPPGATPAGTHRARADALAALLKSALGLTAAVVLRAPGEIPRSTGKAVRVIDLRATPLGGADATAMSPPMPPPLPPSGEPR